MYNHLLTGYLEHQGIGKNIHNLFLEKKVVVVLGGGFKHVLFSPLFWEDSHFD